MLEFVFLLPFHLAKKQRQLLFMQRLAQQIALHKIALPLLQGMKLLVRFDAFRDDGESQLSRQRDDPFDENGPFVMIVDMCDKRAVDFDRRKGESRDVFKRGVFVPKSSNTILIP